MILTPGVSTESDEDLEKLENEKEKFGDIREGDFIDSYENLAQKTLFSYDIAHSNGNRIVFVIKKL